MVINCKCIYAYFASYRNWLLKRVQCDRMFKNLKWLNRKTFLLILSVVSFSLLIVIYLYSLYYPNYRANTYMWREVNIDLSYLSWLPGLPGLQNHYIPVQIPNGKSLLVTSLAVTFFVSTVSFLVYPEFLDVALDCASIFNVVLCFSV